MVFVHEFAGDLRSWEPQLRYFSRFYRCIAYNARGYPPSDVPAHPSAYGQDIATDDIAAVMRACGIDKAHVVGLSMGGFAAAHFAMRYSRLARSVVPSLAQQGIHAGARDEHQLGMSSRDNQRHVREGKIRVFG